MLTSSKYHFLRKLIEAISKKIKVFSITLSLAGEICWKLKNSHQQKWTLARS
jgi:hypothetical protein